MPRVLHILALAVAAAAMAVAVFGTPRLAIALLAIAVFLLVRSLERLRTLVARQETRP